MPPAPIAVAGMVGITVAVICTRGRSEGSSAARVIPRVAVVVVQIIRGTVVRVATIVPSTAVTTISFAVIEAMRTGQCQSRSEKKTYREDRCDSVHGVHSFGQRASAFSLIFPSNNRRFISVKSFFDPLLGRFLEFSRPKAPFLGPYPLNGMDCPTFGEDIRASGVSFSRSKRTKRHHE